MPITLRPAVLSDSPTLAVIHSEGWRTAYAAFMPAEFLAQLDPASDEKWISEWVVIWTFRQARSCQFYRKLGFEIVRQTHNEFGGQQQAVDIYGGDL